MSQTANGQYQGTIDIDGVVRSERVVLYFSATCSDVVIGDLRSPTGYREQRNLRPFGIYMLSAHDSAVMKAGIAYTIAGTQVGSYVSGPLGNLGDGEYDIRPISRFDVLTKYTAKQLSVEIWGATDIGYGGMGDGQSRTLKPWSFRIVFIVPSADMQRFFGIQNHNMAHFESLVRACG